MPVSYQPPSLFTPLPLIIFLCMYVGFVISGNRILTNAHVVADHTFVLVRKHGSPTKHRATVLAIAHECDLAILLVQTLDFWHGINPLDLGHVPFLQQAVAVLGYPQGKNNQISLYLFSLLFLLSHIPLVGFCILSI